ncbi:MAG: PAS-domain containing protein, partial [Alphaproteobacteria bacterium]|nr:PAS-domain containing protein [Alphaproteobacteria bacterium]
MAAIDSVSDGFALFDADDRLVFSNRRFKELNPDLAPKIVPGISFEEMLRENIAANRILSAIGDEEAFIRARMEQHRNPSGPLVQQRRDGRWLELREERTPEGATFLVNTDITERKRAEESSRQLIAAFNALNETVTVYDADDRLVFCNERDRTENSAVAESTIPGITFEDRIKVMLAQGLIPEAQ